MGEMSMESRNIQFGIREASNPQAWRTVISMLDSGGTYVANGGSLSFSAKSGIHMDGRAGAVSIDGNTITLSAPTTFDDIAGIPGISWDGQGLGGRVMRLLWSGSCSHGGTISNSQIPHYNIFSFETNGGGRGLCVRNSSGLLQGVAAYDAGSAWVQNFSATISGSTLTGVNCRTTPLNNGGNQQWQNITRLYGVL